MTSTFNYSPAVASLFNLRADIAGILKLHRRYHCLMYILHSTDKSIDTLCITQSLSISCLISQVLPIHVLTCIMHVYTCISPAYTY